MKSKLSFLKISTTRAELLVVTLIYLLPLGVAVYLKLASMFIGTLCAMLLMIGLICRNGALRLRAADTNRQHEALISNIRGGVQITVRGADGQARQLQYASDGFREITGYAPEDIRVIMGGDYSRLIYAGDRVWVQEAFETQCAQRGEYAMEYRLQRRSGEIAWVLDRGRVIYTADGAEQVYAVLTDITELREQQERLQIIEERFRLALQGTDNSIFEYDYVKYVYLDFINAEQLLGKSCSQLNQELAGLQPLGDARADDIRALHFYHKDDVKKVRGEIDRAKKEGEASYVARLNTADGGYVWCKVHLTVTRDADGNPRRVLGFLSNIDNVKRQAELFKTRSEIDALTGFYNKGATISIVNDILSKHNQISHVMFVLDIDNFKSINDTMGHMAGDAVIAEASERVRSIFRSDDVLGRVGGDEFVVLIGGLTDEDHIVRKAREIAEAFRTMSINAGGIFNISISIGIYAPGESTGTYDSFFSNADRALYAAKRRGKNCYVFYSEELEN